MRITPVASQSQLLTVNEVCEHLHLSRPVVYELINSGKLRSFRVGRARRIPVVALDAYVSESLGGNGLPVA